MRFFVGDLVYHKNRHPEDEPGFAGEVVGFCPGPQWIRVVTADGRKRIWLADNIFNVSASLKEGPHADAA